MNAAPLTLAGPPGSGKSTAGRAAARTLGLEFVSAGELFRAEASHRGLDLMGLSALAERDPSIDRALDDRMVALAVPGRLLDGRIVGALCRSKGVAVRAVLIHAREELRWARLAGRDRQSVSEAREAAVAREASERSRYRRYYGIDLADLPADLTIDSSELSAEAVAERIVAFARRTESGGR